MAYHIRPGLYTMQFPDEERTIRFMLGEVVIALLRAGARDDIVPTIAGKEESVAVMGEEKRTQAICFDCYHWTPYAFKPVPISVVTPYCGGFGRKWHHEISYNELYRVAITDEF